MKTEDISWISQELPPSLNVTAYVVDDPTAPLHPPKNKGHEVMIYLSYIIEHYDNPSAPLADVTLFMHAHRHTHHNNELLGHDAVQMLRRLSPNHVLRKGYVNLRCHWNPGCPEWLHPQQQRQQRYDNSQSDDPADLTERAGNDNDDDEAHGGEEMGKQESPLLPLAWRELFPSSPLPLHLSQPCCAQFALSRTRIHSIPFSRYVLFRDWMLRTPLTDYISGRVWEYTWQFLFTGQGAVCPAEHRCYCDLYGICFGGGSSADDNNGGDDQEGAARGQGYEEFMQLKKQRDEIVKEAKRLREAEAESPRIRLLPSTSSSSTRGHTPAVEAQKGKAGGKAEAERLDALARALDRELEARRQGAIERGQDPKLRALECGREEWRQGYGF